MALKIIKKGELSDSPVAPAPDKTKRGQAKKLPVEGIRFDVPMRLRVGHMLSLFAVSGPQFYKLRKAGKIPEPIGHIGTGTRPTPYWLTTQIAPYLMGQVNGATTTGA